MKNNFSVSQKVNIKIYLRHIVIKNNYFTMGSSHSGKNGRLEIVKDEIPLSLLRLTDVSLIYGIL